VLVCGIEERLNRRVERQRRQGDTEDPNGIH
jgi:hypothetical protein